MSKIPEQLPEYEDEGAQRSYSKVLKETDK